MKPSAESLIAAAGARQHGVATRRQLLEAGLSTGAIERRLRSERYRRLHAGVYLILPFPLPHTREMAAVLAGGAGATLSGLSAAGLLGLHPVSEAPVDVIVLGGGRSRPGLRAHHVKQLAAEERTVREGIPVTSPGRTLIDIAAVLGRRQLENAVARALRDGLDCDVLRERLAQSRGRRGMSTLRAVLDTAGGPALTRSAAEETLLDLVRRAGLPAPQCNARIGRYEIDFLWRRQGIAVEVDGYRYHGSRQRFEGDRRKDAELVAMGLTVLRLSWRQITQERVATAVRIGQALARAGDRR